MSEATNRVLEAQLRRQKQHDKRQKEWETALKPTTIDGSGVLRQLGQQPLDNRQILPNTASLNRPIRPTAVPGGVVADWLPRVKKEVPEVKTTSLYRPQGWSDYAVYYLQGATYKSNPDELPPDPGEMPKKYLPQFKADGSLVTGQEGDINWWSSGCYKGLYLEGIYYLFMTDNEGWARYMYARGDDAYGGDPNVDYYGLPFIVSRDGITWTTPVLEENIYTKLGITEGSDSEYRYSYTTLEMYAETYAFTTSADYSVIFGKSRDLIDVYVAFGNYSNAESLSKNGSPYHYSLDRGRTWGVGITNEKSSDHYAFASDRPCYANGSVYWGYGDWIENRRRFYFDVTTSVVSGSTLGSTSMVLTASLSSASVGNKFTVIGHAPIYTTTNIDVGTKTITFTPALTSTGSINFNWALLTSSDRALTEIGGYPMVGCWSPPSTVTVEESWPSQTLDFYVNANTTTLRQIYYAQNYTPLTDTYLMDFHGVDDQFAPGIKQSNLYQWTGQDRVVGILWGRDWLCPYLEGTTTRIAAGDLSKTPVTISPFTTYTDFYRALNCSEAYRLNSLGEEPAAERGGSQTTPRAICGVYIAGAVIDRLPEEVLPDALTLNGSYWDSTGYGLILSPYEPRNTHAGSTLALVVIGFNTANDECLFYTTDGLTYNLIPNSDTASNNILGYVHDGGTVDDEYSGINYDVANDEVVVYYKARVATVPHVFSARTTDAVTWETTDLGAVNSLNDFSQLFEGDPLPRKGQRKSPPTLTIN